MLNKIHNIDALSGLKQLEDNSVDCIITSPPYYQLRDYQSNKQIGLEPTIDEYIDKLVEIFEECKRVLKTDGTMWLNISDTYNGSKIGKTDKKISEHIKEKQNIKKAVQQEIKNKSLLGIPSRLSIKLVDNGWVLRNEIVWYKPNAMPSSVKDRFTVDYEKIFFFTKEPKYHFNQLKEPMKTTDINPPRGSKGVLGNKNKGLRKQDELGKPTYTGFNDRYEPNTNLERNMRSVWEIPTQPSNIKHFAMFPQELVERAIAAGCKVGGCVVDPFSGSGTTAIVAKKMNRDYIGFEVNKQYAIKAQKRADRQPRIQSIFNLDESEND